jgi:hypothetical protein
MSNGGVAAGGAAGGAAAAAAIANAIKASGVLVRVENNDFINIINRIDRPLIVIANPGFLSPGYKYLTSYRGLAFYTKSPEILRFPGSIETILAKKIHIPG